jgi:hypothetical protein
VVLFHPLYIYDLRASKDEAEYAKAVSSVKAVIVPLKGPLYIKNIGPRTDPWGAPHINLWTELFTEPTQYTAYIRRSKM